MSNVRKKEWTYKGVTKFAWAVSYVDLSGTRRQQSFESKKAADRFRLKIDTEIDMGTHVAYRETKRVSEVYILWMEELRKRVEFNTLTKASFIAYKMDGDRFNRSIGGVLVTEIREAHVQKLVDDLAKKYAPRTVHHSIDAFLSMIDFSVSAGFRKVDGITKDRLRMPRRERAAKIPSRAELEHILAVSETRKKNERERTRLNRHAILCLALFSTLRRGEICGLRWDDIDLDRGVICVKQSRGVHDGVKGPKTAAGVRDAPMPSIVRDALLALPGPRRDYIFTRSNGRLPNPGNLGNHWYYLCDKAGMSTPPKPGKRYGEPHYRFHDMRHAAASLLIAKGANALHVSRAMGHASVTTTLGIYGHLFKEDDTIRITSQGIADDFETARERKQLSKPAPTR